MNQEPIQPQASTKLDLKTIISALIAIPKILSYLQKFGEAIKKMELEKDLKALEEASSEYEKAKTPTERLAAAHKLFKSTRGL